MVDKRARLACPAVNCQFAGDSERIKTHWRATHCEKIQLFMCPYRNCQYKHTVQSVLELHVSQEHGCTDLRWYRGLPPLCKWLVTASGRTLARFLLRHGWARCPSVLCPFGPRGSWRSWWTLHPLPSWSRPHRWYQPCSNFSQCQSSRRPSSSSQPRPSRLPTWYRHRWRRLDRSHWKHRP